MIFKGTADTVFLDDFKKVLDSLVASALNKVRGQSAYGLPSGRNNTNHSMVGTELQDRKGPIVGKEAEVMEDGRPRLGSLSAVKSNSSEVAGGRTNRFGRMKRGKRVFFPRRQTSSPDEMGIIRQTSFKLESSPARPKKEDTESL